jgi:hypothetical protein
LRLDYRKLSALLEDAPNLTAAIELKSVPHFTTFHKAAQRLLMTRHARSLLDETVSTAKSIGLVRQRVALAALDGTGFETRHISAYFVKRRARACKTGYETTTYTRYPYAELACDCRTHFVLAVVTGRGPGPDLPYFRPALRQTLRRTPVRTLLADAGFDSEWAHESLGANAAYGRSSRRRAADRRANLRPAIGETECGNDSPNGNTVSAGKAKPSSAWSNACWTPRFALDNTGRNPEKSSFAC